MEIGELVTAGLLVVVALAHSVAGDLDIIRPVLAGQWEIDGVQRADANRLVRVAWHLTSMAWLALAAIVVGWNPLVVVSVMALGSGLAMLWSVPGHPAWPAFLLAGLSGLRADGALGSWALGVAATAAVIVVVGLAALHVAWAAGSRWQFDGAVPTTADGDPTFSPGRLATVAVAGLLSVFAALVTTAAVTDEPWFVTGAVLAGVAVLAARAVGDGRYSGFTKKERSSLFGQRDDRWYTPLVVLLALAASGATLI